MQLTEIVASSFEVLNETLQEKDWNISLVLIGGQLGAYLLSDFRSTFDVDVLIKDIPRDANRKEVEQALYQSNLESVTVVEIPPVEEIEFKNEDTIKYSNLTVYIPTIEYFALTKIFSARDKDEADLKEEGILQECNIEKLLELIDEYKKDVLNPNNMNYNFNSLEKLFEQYK
ncbi:hypothetical protein CNY62_00835 [Brochothrix thermosphacta]|uniref:DUF6036 domain-containing protein n=1 Tax=Brochothrix thermosphacta TaxID=2756 RepID=A0A291BVA9_BROTH|nr:DUF6036 family nucleotidyltransferase [Brochothrix thermosphacta]ATF25036.1 hypothetical protein CNY62_00835 [Brochothrix thermosphacta]